MIAAALLALSLSAPAHAATRPYLVRGGTATLTGYEEFSHLGWGDACSIAVQYLRFPKEGVGMRGIPDAFRVGIISLGPGEDKQTERWTYSSEKGTGYSPESLAAVAEELRDKGRHDRAGMVERLRQRRVADQPGLEDFLMSTDSFKTEPVISGVPDRFRFSAVYYSPLGSCGLFLFQDKDNPRDGIRTVLARIPEPGVRHLRARAHVNNGLLFYRNDADLVSSEAELAVAAAMDPRYGLARYHHAVLLTLHGRFDEAIESLKAAVARNAEYADEARRAPEFDALREDSRFLALLKAAPAVRRRAPPQGRPGEPSQETASPPVKKKGPPDRRRF